MTLAEAILKGEARAHGQLSDIVRNQGGTYNEVYDRICEIFKKAGRTAPNRPEYDDKMAECDDLESRG